MEDKKLLSDMTLSVLWFPILEKLQVTDPVAGSSIKQALHKAEKAQSGFALSLTQGLLEQAELTQSVDYQQALLSLVAAQSEELRIERTEPVFTELNERAANLRLILARIPAEIQQRKTFLDIIRDIASGIKGLLDCVNRVAELVLEPAQRQILDQRKREFVRYSKLFSETLKEFFKSNDKARVIRSANHLAHRTNLIIAAVKSGCR